MGTGLIATALLMANNIRDIPTDKDVGKMTLAVRLGDEAARISYVMMLAVAILLPLVLVSTHPWMWLILLTALLGGTRAGPLPQPARRPDPGAQADRHHQPCLRRVVHRGNRDGQGPGLGTPNDPPTEVTGPAAKAAGPVACHRPVPARGHPQVVGRRKARPLRKGGPADGRAGTQHCPEEERVWFHDLDGTGSTGPPAAR